MKRITFFKSLLVAAGLLMGASAWAEAGDVTTNANISFSSAETSNDNVLENVVFNGTINSITIGQGQFRASQAGWLSLDDATSTITIPEAQRAGAKDVVRVQFKRAWGNKNGMGSGFSLKDAEGALICNYTYARWGGGSNSLNINMDGLLGAALSNAPIKERYTSFDITIDYKTRTITSTVECVNNDGKGTHKSETFYATLTNTNPIATFNVWGYNVGGNKDRADIINDILITTTEGDYSVDEYDYTVNWVCDEEIVKTATRQGEADADIALLASDDDPFWVSTKKYFFVSSDVAGKKVSSDGSTVVTINVREAENWDYTINAVDGSSNFLKLITAGIVVEGESVTITYPQNVYVSNKLYDIALNGSNPRFKRTITPTGDDYVVNLTYSNGVVNNVIYYTEAENITGVSTGTNVNYASMDKYGYAADYKEVTTLPAGKYIAKARFDCGNSASEKHYYLKVGENVVMDGVCTTQSLQNYTTTEEFTVTSPATLYFKADGGSATGVDWFYIQKTNEVATIGATGWTTFASPYALNLSSMTASTGDVAAYYASAVGDVKVTMTSTASAAVAAGTGLMLKGTASATITIPVVASAGEAISGNKLVGCTTETVLGTNADYYVLVNNSGTAEFQSLADNGATIPAGKAYLNVTGAGARLSIAFDDETTGIENLTPTLSQGEGAIYDLQGCRVAAPQKGLYIVNGKKVIMK